MPVAGSIKLDIVAQAQDKVRAVLRSTNAELARTQAALVALNGEGDREAAVADIVNKAQERRKEQRASERRALVEQERAHKANTSALGGFIDTAGGLDKVRSKFEQVGALVGWAGAIGAAVGAMIEFVKSLDQASDASQRVGQQVKEWGDLAEKARSIIDGLADARVAEPIREAAEFEAKRTEALQTHQRVQARIADVTEVIAEKTKAIAEADAARDNVFGSILNVGIKQRALDVERKKLIDEMLTLKEEEKQLALEIESSTRESTREATVLAAALGAALKGAADGASKAIEKPKKPRGGAGGGGGDKSAETIALEERVTLTQAASSLELAQIVYANELARIEREIAKHKLDAYQADLRRQLADSAMASAEESYLVNIAKAEAEAEAARTKAAEAAAAAQEKRQKDAVRQQATAEKAQRDRLAGLIRGVGNAAAQSTGLLGQFSEAFKSLTSLVESSTSIWEQYAQAQLTVGQAVAAQIGVTGQAVASGIESKKGQAIVEGGFEAAAAIASFASGDVPGGILHTAASVGFFALAGGQGGGTKTGAVSGGAGGSTSAASSRGGGGYFGAANDQPRDTRSVVIVQYSRGIVYGLGADVARAADDAALSLVGSGMQHRRY